MDNEVVTVLKLKQTNLGLGDWLFEINYKYCVCFCVKNVDCPTKEYLHLKLSVHIL